jgi:hypothetical protein
MTTAAEFTVLEIPREVCVPSKHNLAGAMGYRELPVSVDSGLDRILPLLDELITPRGGFIFADIIESGDTYVDLGVVRFDTDSVIGRALTGATKLALFTGTIGSALETRAEEYMKAGDTFLGYLCDVAGSAAAEKTAAYIHARVREAAAAEGLSSGNRYSPGYCGWDVSEQRKIFTIIPEGRCGVSLTESSMMYPVKSVSGVIPVGVRVMHRPYACAVCTRKDCTRRNAE